jgi:integrase
MACKVKVNRHGYLAFRLYWDGLESWEGTQWKDTPRNRERAQARAVLISEEMDKDSFDYLKWFPEGNRADEFRPKKLPHAGRQTVGEYYAGWIERKKPPFVRPGLHHDYARQFRRYILPKFEHTAIADVGLAELEAFRLYLNGEMGLSLKSCRNIIDGTFRAMIRDARKHGIGVVDHFAGLGWPRIPASKPDPFTAEERDTLLVHFKTRQPFYYPFVFTQFWTGMRPSEAIALRWGDVDLISGNLSISKSRYYGADNPTKTAASERDIALLPAVVNVLRSIKPLHVSESDYVFKNREGRPINEDKWRAKYWYRAVRSCGVRPRKFYATKHTFISIGLSQGVNIKWVAEYCGTSVVMIEKHYGKYISNDSQEQLTKLLAAKTETFTETREVRGSAESTQVAVNSARKKWSGRVDLNHRLHGPEPCALPS